MKMNQQFKRRRLASSFMVAGLVIGAAFSGSASAAPLTKVTWQVSSLLAQEVRSLSALVTTNSPGVKTWSEKGSCLLIPKNKPSKLMMGSKGSCVLTLKIAKTKLYSARTSTKTISLVSATPTTLTSSTTTTVPAATTTSSTVPAATTTSSTVPAATTTSSTVPAATTTSSTVPAATTTVPENLRGAIYSVGQTGPGGGKIFYIDMTRNAGSQYFEAACTGWSDGACGGSDASDPSVAWGCNGADISGANGEALGTGRQNTNDIVTGCATTGIPAQLADALVLGGRSDWYLASKDEHIQMEILGTTLGLGDGFYWTSTEESGGRAPNWAFARYGSGTYGQQKTNAFSVRPIRSF